MITSILIILCKNFIHHVILKKKKRLNFHAVGTHCFFQLPQGFTTTSFSLFASLKLIPASANSSLSWGSLKHHESLEGLTELKSCYTNSHSLLQRKDAE